MKEVSPGRVLFVPFQEVESLKSKAFFMGRRMASSTLGITTASSLARVVETKKIEENTRSIEKEP